MTFAPAPLRARHDGWTAERQTAFIAALARARSITKAAAAVGMSRRSAYRLRQRPEAAAFAAAWDAAMAMPGTPIGTGRLEQAIADERVAVAFEGRAAIRIRPCSPKRLMRLLDRAEAFKRRQGKNRQKAGLCDL